MMINWNLPFGMPVLEKALKQIQVKIKLENCPEIPFNPIFTLAQFAN